MHSPFVFELIDEVLNDKRSFYAYENIEGLRQALLMDDRILQIEDLGAGSRTIKENTRTVATIAKSSLKPKKYSQLLFRIVDHYQPQTIIELGTSLGLTTAYLASAKTDAKVITMEGASSIANIAKENFSKLKLNNMMHYHKLDTISVAWAKMHNDPKLEHFSLREMCKLFNIINENKNHFERT